MVLTSMKQKFRMHVCGPLEGIWAREPLYAHATMFCTDPCAPRLQPECQEDDDGGGRMRWLSSCICKRIGLRNPQEMFSRPSTMNSPSSYRAERARGAVNRHTWARWKTSLNFDSLDANFNILFIF